VTSISDVSCGYYNTFVVDVEGRLYVWGCETFSCSDCVKDMLCSLVCLRGAMGLTPRLVPEVDRVLSVSCGWRHFLIVTTDGRVFTFGEGSSGQLGHGDHEPQWKPTMVDSLYPRHSITSGAAGDYHCLALSGAGAVFAWGENVYGQVGTGDTEDVVSPRCVLKNKAVVCVAAGHYHSMALSVSGEVYSWGRNTHGQLGHGDFVSYHLPTLVEALPDIKQIACGGSFSAAVSREGELFTWGMGKNGQLGHNDEALNPSPRRVDGLAGRRVSSVALGESHCLALTETGEVLAWGSGVYGRLGCGDDGPRRSPALVVGLNKVRKISAGWWHSAAVTEEGRLYTWGGGEYGQLGHGSRRDEYRPRLIKGNKKSIP
jgi:alpha-tubulin suppressor-like RCC1 family protein